MTKKKIHQEYQWLFDGFILTEKGEYRSIDKSYTLNFGKDATLTIKQKKDNKVSGNFKISFSHNELSFEVAEEKRKQRFEQISSILSIKKLRTDFKWGEIEPLVPKSGKFHTTFDFHIKGHVITPHAPILSDNEVHSVEDIYSKVSANKQKGILEYILKINNIETKRDVEQFFYQWVSFNIIYNKLASTDNNKTGIKHFSQKYPDNDQLKRILTNHEKLVKKLAKENWKDRSENLSNELRNAFRQKNERDVWKYTLLCMYQIRNELFHQGKEYHNLKPIIELMKDVVSIGFFAMI